MVQLVNADSEESVPFVLNGRQEILEPQHLLEKYTVDPMTIKYDRGGDLGPATNSLTEGVYVFKRTEKGWNLVRRLFQNTFDNRANMVTFRCLVDGKLVGIPAGSTSQTERALFPHTVYFDQGGQPKQMALAPGTTYRIVFDPQAQLWDLAPSEAG